MCNLELLDSWSTTPRLHPQGWGVVGWPHSEVIIDHPFPFVGWKNSPNLHQQRKIKVENSFILIIYPMPHSNSSSKKPPNSGHAQTLCFFNIPVASPNSNRRERIKHLPHQPHSLETPKFHSTSARLNGKANSFFRIDSSSSMKIRCPGTPEVWFWQLQPFQHTIEKQKMNYIKNLLLLPSWIFSLQCRPESVQSP